MFNLVTFHNVSVYHYIKIFLQDFFTQAVIMVNNLREPAVIKVFEEKAIYLCQRFRAVKIDADIIEPEIFLE